MFNFKTNKNKIHSNKLKIKKKRYRNLTLGTIGIQSLNYGIFKITYWKSIKRITMRILKGFKGTVWLKTIPNIPITKKPREVRMGKGVGKIDYWLSIINPFNVFIEFDNVSVLKIKKLYKIISTRLPYKLKIITNQF